MRGSDEREGEKKAGVLGRMKADLKGGWDRRMNEEDERLERKRLEMAMEKKKKKRRKRNPRSSTKHMAREQIKEDEIGILENDLGSLALNGQMEKERGEVEMYLRRSKTMVKRE